MKDLSGTGGIVPVTALREAKPMAVIFWLNMYFPYINGKYIWCLVYSS